MKSKLAVISVISAALLFSGCSSTDPLGKDMNYHTDGASLGNNLEVPPDLTSINRKSNYAIPNSSTADASSTNSGTTSTNTMLVHVKNVEIERDGNQRWLLVKDKKAADIWPALKIFWQKNGFIIKNEDPSIGFMETEWAENRAKLPNDGVRKLLEATGLGSIYSTAERDKFLIRLEETDGGTEIYFSHRGLYETYNSKNDSADVVWEPRPSDPNLEAVFLGRFMVSLGVTSEQAKETLSNAPKQTNNARAKIEGQKLILTDEFSRAWRRTGPALDRIGMTVVDKDRSKGVYFVNLAKDDVEKEDNAGILSKLAFWRSKSPKKPSDGQPLSKYRVELKQESQTQTSLRFVDNQGNELSSQLGKTTLSKLQTELQ